MKTTMELMVAEARAKMINTVVEVLSGDRRNVLATGIVLGFNGEMVNVSGRGWERVCYCRFTKVAK